MSNILNIAVIGSSKMGRLHMKGVELNERAHLYAICDTDSEVLEIAKKEFNPDIAVNDYKELVNDPKVDAAILVTPDKLHLEMTRAFLEAGKAVLCEKPMALSVEECTEMMRIEKETNGKLMIGQVCRCTPAFVKAKEIVDSGRIGDLFFVESEYAHSYENSRGKDDWRVTPERDGFIGGGCHAVDLLRWIAGNPIEVTAYSNHKCLTDWPTNDCTIAIFKFPNNVIGKAFTSIGCRRDYTMRTVLYGTKGTIICDNTSPTMSLYTCDEPLEDGTVSFKKPQIIDININNHNVTLEIDEFINSLNSGKPFPVPSTEGADTVTVCCSAVKSAKENRPVQIEYKRV